MKLVTVWDYFMRRKGLLLMLLAFFSLSGLTSYQFFGGNHVDLDVPKSGDPEVVDNYINIDEVVEEDETEEREVTTEVTPEEAKISSKVDGERNGIIVEPQHESKPRTEATIIDPMDDREIAWQAPSISDEVVESRTSEATEESGPEVKIETIAMVGGVVVVLEIGARRLLRRYFPKED